MFGFMAITCLILAIFIAAIPHILWLILFLIGKIFSFHLPYAPFGWTALGLVIFCWLIITYGYVVGRWKLETNVIDYQNEAIPTAFDGYKIVHISDLHLSTFDDNPQKLTQIVDQINQLKPDLVCFTGDLVTTGVGEAQPYTLPLQNIKANDGVVSVLGNHDFLIYARQFKNKSERENAVWALCDFEQNTLGWHLLRNESTVITRENAQITVIGVDNINNSRQGFSTINSGDLPKAMEGTNGFRILLSHDPSHWSAEVVPQTDIPLTLSGHTHAAQIRLFGWSPAQWMFKHVDGLHQQDGQTIYINIGLGCTLPVRIGANPEITLIRLRK